MKKISLKRKMKLCSAFTFACCITLLISCSEWDEFKKYTKDGEIVYPGKFDTVTVFPGNNRIRVWGKMTSDPKVKTAKIFWDNNRDSAEFEVDDAGSDYTFDQVVNVGEGVKSFTLRTYDGEGHKSVGVVVTSVVYGDRYRNTLSNRRMKFVAYGDAATTIHWEPVDPMLGVEGMEVLFKNVNGETVIVKSDASEETTVLPEFDYLNEEIRWRTIYRPITSSTLLSSIDTFITKFAAPMYVEASVDLSLLKGESIVGDTWPNGGSGGVKAMWDGKSSYETSNFTDIESGKTSPQMVTFSIGAKDANLTKLVIYPFREWWGSYYVFSTIRDYEIYGSSNPSSSGALDETWTLLASGTFAKPSGRGKDDETDADRKAASDGFTVNLTPTAPKVKYIRIRCLKNYESYWAGNNNAFFSVAEIRVFGILPQ